MENQQEPQMAQASAPIKLTLPNSTEALILGICSIPVGCCFLGILGLISGIIAIVLGGKAMRAYQANPDMYTTSSYDNAKAGRICGIVGTVLSSIYVLAVAVYLILILCYGAWMASVFSNMQY